MDEDKAQRIRSLLPAGMGAGVGALLILIFGQGLVLSPFETARPRERRLQIDEPQASSIEARLWEDPLAALDDYVARQHGEKNEAEAERRACGTATDAGTAGAAPAATPAPAAAATDSELSRLFADRSRAVAVIAAVLDGDSTSEAAESRLRSRVAVISALAQRGLIPDGDGRLYFAHLFKCAPAGGTAVHEPLAFEIFHFDPFGEGARHPLEDTKAKLTGALAVWIDERTLETGDGERSHPIDGLTTKLADLLSQVGVKANNLESVRFVALAPATSRLLGDMAEDLAPPPEAHPSPTPLAERTVAALKRLGPATAGVHLTEAEEAMLMDVAARVDPTAKGGPNTGLQAPLLQRAIASSIQVYSSRATTPLALARLFDFYGANPERSPEEPAKVGDPDQRGLAMAPQRLKAAVLSDQVLASALVDELGRRGIDLVAKGQGGNIPPDHMVLVSEWDTLYGRSLPFMFEVELTRRASPDGTRYEDLYEDRLTDKIPSPPNVHRFTYLRGLDGETSERRDSPAKSDRSPSNREGAGGSASDERAARLRQLEGSEGPGQLDMIRRVGDRIAALDGQLRSSHQGSVRAIGVLGSDFHDKLIVLQALRSQFPDAVFFTTDLDARLLQPRWYSLTRNLLIASSYGLELSPHLQCRIPPFRDTYSTATFAAVLSALQSIDPRPMRAGEEDRPGVCLPVSQGNLLRLRPLLFEVGRRGAVELAPVDDGVGTHPAPGDPGPTARRVALVGFPLLAMLFWWLAGPLATLLAPSGRRGSDDPGTSLAGEARAAAAVTRGRIRQSRARWLATGGALVVMFACWQLALSDARAGGEPLYWFDGVSAWPSELLFVLATLVSVFLLARAIVALRTDGGRMEPYFIEPSTATSRRTEKRVWLGWLRAGWANLGLRRWSCNSDDPAELWHTYSDAARLRWRFARVAVSALPVLAVMGFLAYLFGFPNLPMRSDVGRLFHVVSASLATVALVVLALFVFDATRLCVCFVDTLTGRDCAAFPKTSRSDRVAASLGLPLTEASDLMALRLVAQRTETVGGLLLYPFVVTALFVAARSGMFDSWSWPRSTTGLVVLVLVTLLASGLQLQHSARRARQRAMRRLDERRLRLLAKNPPAAQDLATEPQLSALRDQVLALDRGAFASWSANPVLGALLLPFGGAGAAWLIDLILQLAK